MRSVDSLAVSSSRKRWARVAGVLGNGDCCRLLPESGERNRGIEKGEPVDAFCLRLNDSLHQHASAWIFSNNTATCTSPEVNAPTDPKRAGSPHYH
jgi:hypothetical protein